jgi:hypothetical protein
MTDRQIRVVIGDLEAFATRIVKRLALNINANLIEDTPVDTGWARANWVLEIGSPFTGTAGTREDAEAGRVDQNPQQLGIGKIAAYKLGPIIYESNNVPYIEKLNDGSSAQAPSAFVQAAILRAVQQTVR